MSEENLSDRNALKEGQSYPFEIKKLINIPGSGEKHFVLIGIDGKRYLLKASHYDHYQLKPGSTINCTIDKINCSGQIFLEPQHPYYEPGKKYDFLVTRITEEENIWGATSYVAWVKDFHRFEWACRIETPEFLEPGMSHLSCRVDRIKKAQLFLSLPSIRGAQVRLRRNSIYDFKLSEIREFQGEYFYIFEDPYGNYHPLPKRYYEHFNYGISQRIPIRVIELKTDGSYVLEPINPYYQLNDVYPFKFLRIEQTIAGDFAGQTGIIWVQDYFGQAVKLEPKAWQLKIKNYQPEFISCKVVKFKKGRVLLENVSQASEN